MGGCRCTFRGCPNNSANSPGMHFFHYPLKYPERLQLWISYADTKHFLEIPASKARNKVVCESHFRDECFMNYKKERLVQCAVPTLVRLPNDMVLDFEDSDNPKPKLLEPTKCKHLIPPGAESSSGSSAVTKNTSSSEEEYIIETIEPIQSSSRRGEKRNFSEVESIDVCSPKVLKNANVTKVINSNLRLYKAAKVKRTTTKVEEVQVHPTTAYLEEYSTSEDFCDEITIEPIEQVELLEETGSRSEEVTLNIQEDELMKDVIKVVHTDRHKQAEEEKIDKAIFDEVVADYEAKVRELKEELEQKEAAEKARITQVETVSTSHLPVNKNPGTLTKGQLFNGIKKYLSPSMAALVRMEMFAGPERPWKSDEKQVSMELLKLGETVFNYLRDEWRIRLPSKRNVQEWLSSCDGVEDEEEL